MTDFFTRELSLYEATAVIELILLFSSICIFWQSYNSPASKKARYFSINITLLLAILPVCVIISSSEIPEAFIFMLLSTVFITATASSVLTESIMKTQTNEKKAAETEMEDHHE